MDGEQFGRYRLEQLIGRGGMGEVYRAYDTVRGRSVALKRLPAHLAQDAEFQARFRKESALAARLSEPHIVPIHDFGEIDGRLFIDMRLVTGRDLSAVLAAEGPLVPERAAAVISQVAAALDAAHGDGLVHRDVKPSNVLLTGEGGREFVYLVDFGIARAVGSAENTSLTATGATIGTMAYMAPERFAGSGDHRMDVYSLGCLLFEILTGRKPFGDEGIPALVLAHLNTEPPRPSRERPAVPPAVDEVVARGMAKDPDHRYPSAGALADALWAALRPAAHGPAHGPTAQVGAPAPPWPAPRTLVGLPDAGFSAPGAEYPMAANGYPPTFPPPGYPPRGSGPTAGGPAPGPSRRPLLIAGAVLVAVLVLAGVVLAATQLGGRTDNRAGPPTSTPTSAPSDPTTSPTTAPDTSATNPPLVRPASLATGDGESDQALWDELKGDGVAWRDCEYSESAVETTLSYLLCDASSPALDQQLGFEFYATTDDARGELTGYDEALTGDPGSCETGGKFTGALLGREVACGYFTFDDGSVAYYVVWVKSGATIFATASDADPGRTWQWFLEHDPF